MVIEIIGERMGRPGSGFMCTREHTKLPLGRSSAHHPRHSETRQKGISRRSHGPDDPVVKNTTPLEESGRVGDLQGMGR